MGWVMGLEPTNAGTTTRCVNHFATPTIRNKIFGAPGEIRTPDNLLRRQMLYPTELQAHLNGPTQTSRTTTCSLSKAKTVCPTDNEPRALTLTANTNFEPRTSYLDNMVGAEGFEPPASCSQGRRATKLRYTPIW